MKYGTFKTTRTMTYHELMNNAGFAYIIYIATILITSLVIIHKERRKQQRQKHK